MGEYHEKNQDIKRKESQEESFETRLQGMRKLMPVRL